MPEVARVVLALEANEVAEEVMHFLDRSGTARVVGTAADDRQLIEAVRQLEPDAVVAHPSLVDPASVRGAALLALDTRESVASLRAAIRVGARGFFLWPGERDALAGATAATVTQPHAAVKRADVVAVHGARGGVGCTFVATHLAQAFAARDLDCVLIDADPTYGDVSSALGLPDDVHTIADLLPLVPELTPAHLDDALHAHDAGFRVLAAPPADRAASVGGADLAAILRVAAASCDVVVAAPPRHLGELATSCLAGADRVLEVLSLDVLSFRASDEGARSARAARRVVEGGVRGEPSVAQRDHTGRRRARLRRRTAGGDPGRPRRASGAGSSAVAAPEGSGRSCLRRARRSRARSVPAMTIASSASRRFTRCPRVPSPDKNREWAGSGSTGRADVR